MVCHSLTFTVLMCVITLSFVRDQEKIRGGSLIAVAYTTSLAAFVFRNWCKPKPGIVLLSVRVLAIVSNASKYRLLLL